ncbi:MAG: alcohol dehydrogenase catalytic domain-containing protein [Rhodocyclaceae bacterium]
MKSIVYEGPRRLVVTECATPQPAAGEVLIKVAYVGVCGSDLNIYQGAHPRAKAPLIMGHEFSGTLVSGHPSLPPGTPVTVYPLRSCCACEPCSTGKAHVCNTLRLIGIDADGGMAEYVKVPADRIMPLPAGVPLELGAFIEPLAVGVHAVRRSGYRAGDRAVVFGAGPIGLCVAACLQFAGAAQVIVVEANPYRLDMARRLGFAAIDAGHEDVSARVLDLTAGMRADFVFDCAAHPSVQPLLVEVAKVQGTIVVVGSYKKPPEVDLLKVEFKELSLVGIRVYEWRDFEIAADFLQRDFDFRQLLTCVPPEEAPARFEALLAGSEVIKLVFKF